MLASKTLLKGLINRTKADTTDNRMFWVCKWFVPLCVPIRQLSCGLRFFEDAAHGREHAVNNLKDWAAGSDRDLYIGSIGVYSAVKLTL